MTSGKMVITIVALGVAVGYCEFLGTVIPPTTWAYALSVNLVLMVAFMALFASLNISLLPKSYFSPKPFERSGRIYRWTGILAFVWALRLIGWERVQRRMNPVRNDQQTLKKYSDSTRFSELVHLVTATCIVLFSLTIAIRHSLIDTKWMWTFNLLLNGYPIMIQRYNRPRVNALLLRLSRK